MKRLLPLILPALVAGCGRPSDPVLARVGPRTVRAADFLKEIDTVPFTSRDYLRSPAGRRELLDLLIRRKIILQAALDAPGRRPELEKTLAELEASYRASRRQLRRRYLEERERLRVSHHMDSLKKTALVVTDEDVRRFWEDESEARAAHILVSDRGRAEELRSQIAGGASFEDLARKFSEDPGTGQKGGDLGYLLRGSLVPEFENALFEMKNGEVSGPVPSPYGVHLIRRLGDRRLNASPLDDAAKTRLRAALESQKFQAWFDRVRPTYAVRIDEGALDDLVVSTAPAR